MPLYITAMFSHQCWSHSVWLAWKGLFAWLALLTVVTVSQVGLYGTGPLLRSCEIVARAKVCEMTENLDSYGPDCPRKRWSCWAHALASHTLKLSRAISNFVSYRFSSFHHHCYPPPPLYVSYSCRILLPLAIREAVLNSINDQLTTYQTRLGRLWFGAHAGSSV